MRIHAGAALFSPGTEYEFSFSRPWHKIDFAGDHVEVVEPVTVSGTYTGQPGSVLVRGRFSTVLRMACGRCLNTYDQPLDAAFDEEYFPGAEIGERDGYSFEGDWIDLSEMVENNIVTHLPAKKLCREDCPGLCPECGRDLSEGICGCRQESQEDNAFIGDLKKLKTMLEEDKEV